MLHPHCAVHAGYACLRVTARSCGGAQAQGMECRRLLHPKGGNAHGNMCMYMHVCMLCALRRGQHPSNLQNTFGRHGRSDQVLCVSGCFFHRGGAASGWGA